MPAQKPIPLQSPASLRRSQEEASGRRTVINELNFTYRRLLRLLSPLAKRIEAPFNAVLRRQHRIDKVVAERLDRAASQQGETPEPCVCAEANALVENVYHAERTAPKPQRAAATIRALKVVRSFLIRTWGQLIEKAAPSSASALQEEARTLQQCEADQHRELARVSRQVEAHD